MRGAIRYLERVFAAGALAACAWAAGATAWAGTLEGTATYRERLALPPAALFEAVLEEISRTDAPGTVLGRATIGPAGQPPFRFAIRYDDAAVQPEHRDAARATVHAQGRLLFTTARAYPVLGTGDAPLELLLVSAGGGRRPSPRSGAGARGIEVPASYEGEIGAATSGSAPWHLDLLPQGRYQLRITQTDKPERNRVDDIGRWRREPRTGRLRLRGVESSVAFLPTNRGRTLRRVDPAGPPAGPGQKDRLERLPQPALIEPRLALTGMFVYLADAAVITVCADGGRVPVVMEGDYRALEAAYLEERRQPGQALLVSLEGLIAPHPSMEEGRPPPRSLVVERFVGVWPGETCGNPLVDSPLRGTHWRLVRLGGTAVRVPENQRAPHLLFARDGLRVSGSGGCNGVTGGFELDGEKLKLGPLAGTVMACPAGMEQEQRFLQSLGEVERYRIRGSHLEMLDASGTMIARFEAAAPL